MKLKLLLWLVAVLCSWTGALNAQNIKYAVRHLTGANPLAVTDNIDLKDESQWIFFDDLKPSEAIGRYGTNISVKGEAMQADVNCRVLIYRHGSVVVPQGKDYQAFTLYNDKDLKGDSQSMTMYGFYTNGAPDKAPEERVHTLELDDCAESFILRRGHMATLATQSDGMGYSRVYVADTADLVVNELPELLSRKVSFVRVLPWQYASKKGWAGSKWDAMPEGLKYAFEQAEFTNSTWYYNWGTSPTVNPKKEGKNYNVEFVPEVWGATSSTSKPYSLEDASHLMGFNEPDHSEQSNVSVEKAISIWPELMKTGMRLGSPATTDFSWLYSFMNECKKRNYRVDYVVVHAYWGGLTGMDWYNKLKDVYDHVKRPIWIKEWNNGANWTKESWPSGTADQQAKQRRDLEQILTVMDTCSFIERYSIYNWVEDKRAIILGSTAKLTPAGEYYTNDQPDYFYRHDMQFTPTYSVRTAPVLRQEGIEDRIVTLTWSDENCEFITQYDIQQSINGKDFKTIATVSNKDSQCQVEIPNNIVSSIYYRVMSTAIDGTERTSNALTVNMIEAQNGSALRKILITENWTSALFDAPFESQPVLILGTPTYRNKMPLSWTARNVSGTSFDFRLSTWDYQESPSLTYPDTIAILAMKKGDTPDFVGMKSASDIVESVTNEWKHVTFPEAFEDIPVVIPSLMTNYSGSASSLRIKNVTTKGFDVHLQFEGRQKPDFIDVNGKETLGEHISYLALQQGSGEYNGRKVVAGISADSAVNDNLLGGTRLDYGTDFDDIPHYFAAMQTEADTITSVLRIKSRDLTGATLIKDREKSVAHERVVPEQVGWIAIERRPEDCYDDIPNPLIVMRRTNDEGSEILAYRTKK